MFDLCVYKKIGRNIASLCITGCLVLCSVIGIANSPYSYGATDENTTVKNPTALLIEAKSRALERCIAEQMVGLEPAKKMRELILQNCQALKLELVAGFPQEIREFTLINIDRRVEAVLTALEDMEGVVSATASDVNEIIEEIDSVSQGEPE